MFVIEDELHAEPQGQFATLQHALSELRRRADIAWDEPPNVAPCSNWRHCGRSYEIVEYDDTQTPWKELQRIAALRVSAKGVEWMKGVATV